MQSYHCKSGESKKHNNNLIFNNFKKKHFTP